MFIPIGDDVNTRTLPFVAIVLIAANIMLWVHTGTLARESEEAQIALRGKDHFQGWDRDGRPIIRHEAPNPKVKKADATKWEDFIRKWGIAATDLAQHEYHGVMSYMFLHGDFFHLLGNMLVFWAFVGTLEATLGPWTMLFLYLFWGMVAGLVQCFANWGSDIPCIGASGAIAGVMGAYFLCFGALSRIKVWVWLGFGLPPKVYQIPAGVFLSLWVFFQIYGALQAQKEHITSIGWFAHLGGFAAGMMTMVLFKREVVGKLTINKEGQLELKRAEEGIRQPAGLPDVLPPLETAAVDEAPVEEIAVANAGRSCQRCGNALTDENRVMDDLFRCPKCKMLSDTSLPPPVPIPGSRTRRT